jgi:hypothetical protein
VEQLSRNSVQERDKQTNTRNILREMPKQIIEKRKGPNSAGVREVGEDKGKYFCVCMCVHMCLC